jgi:long-subunit fatty acid transport protein
MRKLILATSLLAPASAFAGGYLIPQENTRDLGLSSADVADAEGAGALFTNTSELAGPEGLQLDLSGEVLNNRTTWTDPKLGSSSLIPKYATPFSAAASYGKHLSQDASFGIGAGVDVPAGGNLFWPNGWQGQESIQSVKQQVFRIAGGIGIQPAKFLKIGATYQRFQATEELHQSLNYLDHYGDGGIGLSGGANSFGLAIDIYVPTIPLRLGATYSHSGKFELEGSAHFTNVPPAFTPLVHDQSVTEDFNIPKVLYLGAAYDVQPNVTLMAAVNFEGWGVYHQDRFVGGDGFSVTVPRNYNEAHVYRGGLEWNMIGVPVDVRISGLRSVSSQPKDTVAPSLTDGNSWAGALGLGLSPSKNVRIDLAYQHAIFDEVRATGMETFPGSYATHVDIFNFGLTVKSDLGLAKHPN